MRRLAGATFQSDHDAVGCLAGHLPAAKFNVAYGASSCGAA